MAFRYSTWIEQEDGSFLEQLGSQLPHRLLHIDIEIRYVSALNPDTTLETFHRSFAGSRDADMFLSEECVRIVMRSLLADVGTPPEFVDTVLVPGILSHARYANSLPANLERQVIYLRVEVLVEVSSDGEFHELINELLTSSVNFKPASKSSIEALEKVEFRDVEDDLRRKSGSGLSECTVCLDEFSDGDEVTSMPCGHVYHYNCIVEWLKSSHLCPLCRYQMPID
ncbi:hypothetical protein HRI_004310600 [Hibiscus trionum]|uniref:RING-type E3 ubiquitin transferase n=1 Tax=Hibiscus trionum TaxID=183268 RepID=A0A9W7MLE2_HIBTR|nr:hypothetical protein HRI_004310600 [Hibiscus trionum]